LLYSDISLSTSSLSTFCSLFCFFAGRLSSSGVSSTISTATSLLSLTSLFAISVCTPKNLSSANFLSAPKVIPDVVIFFGFSIGVSSYLPIDISPWLQ
jgi:hypothetical protein